MKPPKGSTIEMWLAWVRMPLVFFTGGVGLLWISSYFVGIGHYRSDWFISETGASEEARWYYSNFGSMGFAWRSQEGDPGPSVPPDEVETHVFGCSPSALEHLHRDGFLAWHWVEYSPTKYHMMGTARTGNGHVFVPYWMPFFAGILIVAPLYRFDHSGDRSSSGRPHR